MTVQHVLIVALLLAGGAIAAAGIVRVLLGELRQPSEHDATEHQSREWSLARGDTLGIAALLLVMTVALGVRLWGLDDRGMTHIEVYVPGIPLPAGISEPPPRIGLLETLEWHWHDEPHPQGYYLFMWGWTRAFGVELTALRLPSVLFGVGCVFLLYILGARLFGRPAGLLAATLLTLNGHHIYWSQHARMYVMSCFLGLLSTLILLDLLRTGRRAIGKEIAYVAATWLALFTQIFSWALLAAQMLCVLAYGRSKSGRFPRVFQLQLLVVTLGTPLVAHAIYRSRPSGFLGRPTWDFLQDYLNFGFLFLPDSFSIPARDPSHLLSWFLTALAVLCVGGAVCQAVGGLEPGATSDRPFARSFAPIALGVASLVIGLAIWAGRQNLPMALTAAVPLVALLMIRSTPSYWTRVSRSINAAISRSGVTEGLGIALVLALAPVILMSLVSIAKPILTARGLLVSAPYMVLVLAAGALTLGRSRLTTSIVIAVLLLAHVSSVDFFRQIPAGNDYRGLAERMRGELQEGDLIFVRSRNWVTTPLFYHLRGEEWRLVASDFAGAIRERTNARVWVPLFSDQKETDDMAAALIGYQRQQLLTAHRSRALLYVP